jgi:hypothetical protein
MGPIEKRDPCWCLLVLTITRNTPQRCEPFFLSFFLPSECEWGFRYIFEVAIPILIATSTVDHINQTNTDGDMKMYTPLTNCMLDKNSPWFGCIHILCTDHVL